jgi:hypothetical protein
MTFSGVTLSAAFKKRDYAVKLIAFSDAVA